MTDDERKKEGAEEQVEDLEAPAETQEDVAGGAGCQGGSCGRPSLRCAGGTCVATDAYCTEKTATRDVVVYEQ
jgi:hypothetical protein